MTLHGLDEIGGFRVPASFDEQQAAAASDSLRQRGLITLQGSQPTLTADVAQLVTAGVSFDVALGISQQPQGVPERMWCYYQPDQLVFHDRSDPRVEHFERLDSSVALSVKLTLWLNATTLGAPEGSAFFIPKMALARAEQLRAQAGDHAAHDLLRTLGYPESFLLHVLDETCQIVIVCIHLREIDGNFQAEMQTVMLIRAAQGYWLLEEDIANADQLSAQPVNATTALQRLIAMLQA